MRPKILLKMNSFVNAYFSAHKYHSRADFLSDINLIASNCRQYNGLESTFTKQAEMLFDFTKNALEEVRGAASDFLDRSDEI